MSTFLTKQNMQKKDLTTKQELSFGSCYKEEQIISGMWVYYKARMSHLGNHFIQLYHLEPEIADSNWKTVVSLEILTKLWHTLM